MLQLIRTSRKGILLVVSNSQRMERLGGNLGFSKDILMISMQTMYPYADLITTPKWEEWVMYSHRPK